MDEVKKKFKLHITGSLIVLTTVLAIILTVFCAGALAQEGAEVSGNTSTALSGEHQTTIATYALISAAIAFGLGALGAGYAISHVGAAAMGAIAEKPQMASQALIFVALAEGIVIFGFIMAIMILGKM